MRALRSLRLPSARTIDAFIAAQSKSTFSYQEVDATRQLDPMQLASRYNVDRCQVELGEGPATFDAAKAAIMQWRMLPIGWTHICRKAPPAPGLTVAISAYALGLWVTCANRVVYVFDESEPVRRFGFAYGTLDAHVESGEEQFAVIMDGQQRVRYELTAFSCAKAWDARLAYPLTRRLQRRFFHDSGRALLAALAGAELATA